MVLVTKHWWHAVYAACDQAGCARRDRDDLEFLPEDPYANKEFYVKWRHWSHIHCSWDTRETLLQLAGYKRVKNYIKRMEDLDRRRRVLSREEIELIDVERQMEYELSLQHQVVRSLEFS